MIIHQKIIYFENIYLKVKLEVQDYVIYGEPELTPQQMLELGVFGGKYMTDCQNEFPKTWFTNAKLCAEKHDPKLNFFGVNASKPLQYWREKGWIYEEDPRGWFQWYCRYFMGRRIPPEDKR